MLRKALATLPATLDQTYERILCAISEEASEYALRILRWLTFSMRTLSLNEIAEVVAIDITRDPAFDRDEVLEDPLDALGICSSLVTIATVNTYKQGRYRELQTIVLAHYSVQEYLLSDRIKHGRAKQYSLRKFDCHESITRACLKYLLQFKQPQMLPEEVLDDYALATYSAEYWASHLRETDEKVEETVQIAMDLLTPTNCAFLVWNQLNNNHQLPRGKANFELTLEGTSEPLCCAALLGLNSITKRLLDEGADIDLEHGYYGSALHAASLKGFEPVVRTLLDAGANVNLRSGLYGSALQAAVIRNETQTVKTLLDAGADPNLRCRTWESALEAFTCLGDEQMVKMLLKAGTDVNAQGGLFGSALEAASFGNYEETIKLLLDAGANANYGDISARLEMACKWGQKSIVDVLLNTGRGFQDSCLSRALETVAKAGHKDIVEMLLSAGASIPSDSESLWWACVHGNEQLVMKLLDAGATVWNGNFSSEIQIAKKKGHKRIVEMLCDAGTRWSDSRSIEVSKVSFEKEDVSDASKVTTKRKKC
jgi:ankyrin repeat protein